MPPSSMGTFLARCLLLLVVTIISQLPNELGLKIDSDRFLSSFSYVDVDGERRRVGPWAEGPGWRSVDAADASEDEPGDLIEQTEHISTRRMEWTLHLNKCGGHIPSVVCCVANIPPLNGWSPGDPLHKMKALPFGNRKKKEKGSGPSKRMCYCLKYIMQMY